MFWKGVLRSLEASRIGTFHSFCSAILREFPIEAGVEPGFAILEETIAPTVRDAALSTCIRRWLAIGNTDFLSLAIDRGVPQVRDAIAHLIANRAGRDLAGWLEQSPKDLVRIWEDFRDGPALAPLLRRIQTEATPLLRLLETNEPTHPVMKYRRNFLLTKIPSLDQIASPRDFLIELRENAMVKGGGTKKNWPREEVYQEVSERLKTFRDTLDALITILEPDAGRSLNPAADGLRFARLAREAVEAYAEAKKDEGSLDFDDQLLKVRDLLRDGPHAVLEKIRREIGVLLVDEFQDTDAIQAEILERLAGDDLIGGKLFLVGDSKQSIYRFRGAQPSIFGTYRERFPQAGRLNLTVNFRSVPGVIHFVNALFADAFPGDEHVLKPAPEAVSLEGPAVHFLWAGSTASADERRAVESRVIAVTLKQKLANGWPIRDGRSTRPAQQGDVAILFRSLNDASIYEQALASEQLDYHVVGGSAFFAQQEVIDLINVLSTVEDPQDPLALAGTLRGPFFGLSDEGLYWLATTGPNHLVDGFDRWQSVAELSPDDREVASEAARSLESWRRHKDHKPVAELLEQILQESGFESALMGEFLGGRKRANVRKLVKIAREFDNHGGFTLADFVARLRADWKNPPREEQASTTDEHGQAIRLMTIHQAKGLEFPIVVVPDLDRKPPHLLPSATIHPILGPLAIPSEGDPDDLNPEPWSLGWKLFDTEEKRAENEEAIRLFYVAATRAQDYLILSSGTDPASDGNSAAMKLLASRFDRISGDCLVDLPESWPVPEVAVIPPPTAPTGARSFRAWNRPKLLVTARRIERSLDTQPDQEQDAKPRPRFVDLTTTTHQLVRRVLDHSPVLDPSELEQAIANTCRAIAGWPSSRDSAQALAKLRPWFAHPLAQRISQARERKSSQEFSIAWPFDDPDPTVFRGRFDMAVRDSADDWTLVQFVVDKTSIDRERVNLLLGAYAADSLGFGPIHSGVLIVLDDPPKVIRVTDFGSEALNDAIFRI